MYLVGDSIRVSFKWVILISTKQEFAHTQSAKVSTCYRWLNNQRSYLKKIEYILIF